MLWILYFFFIWTSLKFLSNFFFDCDLKNGFSGVLNISLQCSTPRNPISRMDPLNQLKYQLSLKIFVTDKYGTQRNENLGKDFFNWLLIGPNWLIRLFHNVLGSKSVNRVPLKSHFKDSGHIGSWTHGSSSMHDSDNIGANGFRFLSFLIE